MENKENKSSLFLIGFSGSGKSSVGKKLAKALKRPAIFPFPKFMAKCLFGQMAEETLLADLPVYSNRLKELGYNLSHPDLYEALTHILGKSKK